MDFQLSFGLREIRTYLTNTLRTSVCPEPYLFTCPFHIYHDIAEIATCNRQQI